MNLEIAGQAATKRHKRRRAAELQPNPRACRPTAEDTKVLAKAAHEVGPLRPSASTSASFALKNFVAACEQSGLLQRRAAEPQPNRDFVAGPSCRRGRGQGNECQRNTTDGLVPIPLTHIPLTTLPASRPPQFKILAPF